jgi:hypothetical protein
VEAIAQWMLEESFRERSTESRSRPLVATSGRCMTEIRALLLTDLVDSTSLSGSIGDAAMAKVWAAHDRVARDRCKSGGAARSTRATGCWCCSAPRTTRSAMRLPIIGRSLLSMFR